MRYVVSKGRLTYNGERYGPGDAVPKMSKADQDRLLRLGVIKPAVEEAESGEQSAESPEGTRSETAATTGGKQAEEQKPLEDMSGKELDAYGESIGADMSKTLKASKEKKIEVIRAREAELAEAGEQSAAVDPAKLPGVDPSLV